MKIQISKQFRETLGVYYCDSFNVTYRKEENDYVIILMKNQDIIAEKISSFRPDIFMRSGGEVTIVVSDNDIEYE